MSVVYLLGALFAAFVFGAYAMAALHLDRRGDGLEVARLRSEVARLRAELAGHEQHLQRVRQQWRVARSNEKALAADVVRLTRELREARKGTSA